MGASKRARARGRRRLTTRLGVLVAWAPWDPRGGAASATPAEASQFMFEFKTTPSTAKRPVDEGCVHGARAMSRIRVPVRDVHLRGLRGDVRARERPRGRTARASATATTARSRSAAAMS